MDHFTRMVSNVMTVMHVARAGSFRAAMREGGTGFRTLNQQIKDLESELGFLIFRRTINGIVLTPEGEAVVEQARSIEQSLNMIKRLGKTLISRAEGEVTLAVTEGLGTFWIAPRLKLFQKMHPKVDVRLNPSMNIADMRRFDTDLALQVVEPILPEIKRVRVGTLHLMLCASRRYFEANGTPKTVDELRRHQFIFNTNPQFSDRMTVEQVIGGKLPSSQVMTMRTSSSHYMTIENGAGIGFLPTYGFMVGASVVPVMPQVRYSLDLWLCFHADARALPRVAVTLDWISSVFDPKLYPWFRREFVHPADFGKLIEASGNQALVDPFRFSHT